MLLLANAKSQENEINGTQDVQTIRDCCFHIITETCLQHSIVDQAAVLDRRYVF